MLTRDTSGSDLTGYYARDMGGAQSGGTSGCTKHHSSKEISQPPSLLSEKAKQHQGQLRGRCQIISLLRFISKINADVSRRLGDKVELAGPSC